MNGLFQWSPGITLEQVEEQIIRVAYKHFSNNKTATANALGISIRTLDTKLEKYENDDRNQRDRATDDHKRNLEWLAKSRGTATATAIASQPEKAGADMPSSTAGVRLEPAPQAGTELTMPVPKSQKVQEMLPPQAAASGARRNR